MYGDELSFEEDEAFEFLRALMPSGFAGPDVLKELAPEGWERSGLVRAFHPSAESWHEEQVALYERMADLRRWTNEGRLKCGETPIEDLEANRAPTLAESTEAFEETPIKLEKECREIVGCVLWEIFSNNHSVIADDGREIDLGSFRGASSTLDAFDREDIDEKPGMEDWMDVWDRGDHMRFYCGLAFIEGRADYRPVYEMVFRRLRELDVDWIYRFPQIGVVRFNKPEEPAEPSAYSPSEAFAKEIKQKEDEADFARIEAEMAAAYQASAEAASKQLPPPIVQAYHKVYGRLPSGWPPA
jgi:hypothetical protein